MSKRRWLWFGMPVLGVLLALGVILSLRPRPEELTFLRQAKCLKDARTPNAMNGKMERSRVYEIRTTFSAYVDRAKPELVRKGWRFLGGDARRAIFWRHLSPEGDSQVSQLVISAARPLMNPADMANGIWDPDGYVGIDLYEGPRWAQSPWRQFLERWASWML